MRTAVVTGGHLDYGFLDSYLEKGKFDFYVAADSGLEYFYQKGKTPDLAVGDFDSVQPQAAAYFLAQESLEIRRFNPHKDETDTELALRAALEKGSTEIHLLAATGTRLDHMLGTIRVMGQALEKGVPCFLVDACNRLRLINGRTTIRKKAQYGKYVSFLPFTDVVRGMTLTGFAYPLHDFTMEGFHALGVSNEITADEATVGLAEGILIMVESRDG